MPKYRDAYRSQDPRWRVFFVRHYRWLNGIWLILVAIACVIPLSTDGGVKIPQLDKIVHALFYLPPMTLAVYAGARPTRWAIGLLLFSAGIELVQSPLSYRGADGFDLLANAVGIALGLNVGWRLRKTP